MLKVGLIGLGMMGRHHARVLRNVDGLHLQSVADSNGDPFGVAHGLTVAEDFEDLLKDNLDCVVIALPTVLHKQVSEKFLNAGIHVLVEKPVADSLSNAKTMVKMLEGTQLVGAVGHIERFNSALVELRRRLVAGQAGEIYQIATSRQGGFPPRVADIGVAKDLASHDIDLTAWLACSDYDLVSAMAVNKAGREFEDLIVISGRLQNSVVVSHQVNWISAIKERKVTVTGSKGVFVADLLTSDLTFFENGSSSSDWEALTTFRGVSEGDSTRYAFPKREPLQAELEAFRDAIHGRPASLVRFDEGLKVLQTIEACLTSSATGKMVKV